MLVVTRVVNLEGPVVAALEAEVVVPLILPVKVILEEAAPAAAAIIWVAAVVVSASLAMQVDNKDAVVKGILFLLVFKQIPLLVLLIV